MPEYICKVADKSGNKKRVIKSAADMAELSREISLSGDFLIHARLRSGSGGKAQSIPRKLLLDFTDSMALMLENGLSLKDSLDVAEAIFGRGKGSGAISHLRDEIQKGNELHSTLSESYKNIPPIYIGLVKIGERIGTLTGAFGNLSSYLKTTKKLRDKFFNAMTYPVLVLSIAIVGVILVVSFLIPRILGIFSQLGQNAPETMERSFLFLRVMSVALPVGMVIITVASIVISALRRKDVRFAEMVDRIVLSMPIIGGIVSSKEMLYFSFAMETLTDSGVQVEDGLAEAAVVARNQAFKAALEGVRDRVMRGGSLSGAFLEDSHLPDRAGRWIAVGEKTGNVQEVFAQLRKYYQGEIDNWTEKFMNLIEPGLIVIVGLIMIVLIVVFVLPIFTLYGSLV